MEKEIKHNIPLLDLKREYKFLKKDIDCQLKTCFLTQKWVMGNKLAEFERKAADYLGAKFAVGVGSGTDALILSLRALAFNKYGKVCFNQKDEVITTPFTFIATAEAIMRAGATPVFTDINPDTFNIDPFSMKKAVNKNTVGIIPVHLFGLPCQMEEIARIAKANSLFVIEDCAQAFGSIYKERKVGTLGDAGAFSFFPSKNIGCYGDGGMITTNDSKTAELVRALRDHGQKRMYNADFIGYNSRLDSIQAAVLLAKLKYTDRFNALRVKAAQKYNQGLNNIKQIQISSNILTTHDTRDQRESRVTCSERSRTKSRELTTNYRHVYHLYTIKVLSRRNQLLNYLNFNGISARIYYPCLLSHMKAFKRAKVSGTIENASKILPQILTLPIHPFLKDREIAFIIRHIYRFFAGGK
ncbi:MAG: DegT/DnrJ/EryC1/StrS family aminotransferase [Candidatus Omnitrophota bacterium]